VPPPPPIVVYNVPQNAPVVQPQVDNIPLIDDSQFEDTDSDTEIESGHNTIYPQNFKGATTENADTWLCQFNSYCAYKGHDEAKTKALSASC